jgi:hypothetical protein
MRSFRSVRLLVIPALVLPLLLSTVVVSGSAWAKGSKPVKCTRMSGTYGGSWTLSDCSPFTVIGSGNPAGTIATAFPRSPAVITWGTPVNRHASPLQSTISFMVSQLTGHKNKCGRTALEYELVGSITHNSTSPGVKGRVKLFVCDTGGVLKAAKKLRL